MKPDRVRIREAFLDTTFLLPFFQIGVEVEAFALEDFKGFLARLRRVHFSELSVFEAKAKLRRLAGRDPAYARALEAFGANLAALREDERFVFHRYTAQDDGNFNLICSKGLGLDSFDAIILAQALSVGVLITEDEEILALRESGALAGDPILGEVEIKRWKELRGEGG